MRRRPEEPESGLKAAAVVDAAPDLTPKDFREPCSQVEPPETGPAPLGKEHTELSPVLCPLEGEARSCFPARGYGLVPLIAAGEDFQLLIRELHTRLPGESD